MAKTTWLTEITETANYMSNRDNIDGKDYMANRDNIDSKGYMANRDNIDGKDYMDDTDDSVYVRFLFTPCKL